MHNMCHMLALVATYMYCHLKVAGMNYSIYGLNVMHAHIYFDVILALRLLLFPFFFEAAHASAL